MSEALDQCQRCITHSACSGSHFSPRRIHVRDAVSDLSFPGQWFATTELGARWLITLAHHAVRFPPSHLAVCVNGEWEGAVVIGAELVDGLQLALAHERPVEFGSSQRLAGSVASKLGAAPVSTCTFPQDLGVDACAGRRRICPDSDMRACSKSKED